MDARTHCEDRRPKRRVLMVAACPFPARRGTPIRIERMAESLARHGHNVHVATYHLGDRGGHPDYALHRIHDVPSYRKTDPGPSWRKLLVVDPLLQASVYRLVDRLRPDVIHAHHFEGLLVSLPAHLRHRTPLVFDAHVLLDGELEYYDLGMPNRLRRFAARTLDGLLPRMSNHVIAVSDEIKQRLQAEHGFPAEAVSVVHNGVEASFFEGRRDAYPADGVRRIVFAGNLAKYQGVDLLLDAFRLIAPERADVRLVMVTESATAEFRAQAEAAGVGGRVDFIAPTLESLPSLLSSADVLLNPRTRCPGVPQKLLNYMASGAPIVSFAGSTRYIENGKSGIVVANGDVPAFARGTLELLADLTDARRLGDAARRYAQASLTWDACATAIENVYERITPKHHD